MCVQAILDIERKGDLKFLPKNVLTGGRKKHFTDTVYRNPYCPIFPPLQITQGSTHNRCKFCTMLVETRGLILFPGTPLLENMEIWKHWL